MTRLKTLTALLKSNALKNHYIIFGLTLFIGGALLGQLFTTPAPGEREEEGTASSVTLDEAYLDEVNYVPQEDLAATEAALSEPDSPVPPAVTRKTVTVKRGQGMMDILVNSGASRQDAYKAITALSGHFDMRKLQIGQTLEATYDVTGRLQALAMEKDFDHMIRVDRTEETYVARLEDQETLKITRHVQGVIEDSLFLSAYREGLPNSVIVDLIRIYSFDVDFQREIRKGDQFEIFYERKMSEDGRRVQEGNILYARLTLRGKPINLYRYQPKGAAFADYFHDNGQSVKKALMKTPIEGARLSSYYGKRKHPVLGWTRMHKGLDFGAPTGTPIMAAGDGVVERASRYGSYGNYVRIRHNGTYKTAYAHLSKYGRGIKAGKRVKQGQIIGYVGATGRVTARHLHYEVLVNNKQVNPLRLKIPTGITLKGAEKKAFQKVAHAIDDRLKEVKQNILLAANQIVALNEKANGPETLPQPSP